MDPLTKLNLTPDELLSRYAQKMMQWTDDRLRFEMTLRDNDSWATPATMAIWNAALKAEAERRGLTVAE